MLKSNATTQGDFFLTSPFSSLGPFKCHFPFHAIFLTRRMMMMGRMGMVFRRDPTRIFTSARETRNSCPSRLKMSSFHRQPYVGHAAPFLFKCSRQTNQIHQTNVLLISAISWVVQINLSLLRKSQ